MHEQDYERLDGLALAALLRAGEVTPGELMDCAIALARERAPALNAIACERYEESRQLADRWQLRGPFAGIPFLLKDSSLAATRMPTSLGSRLFADTRYQRDATLTERFDAAGFIPFARTTVPELCMAPTTEAAHNGGPTRNPWDHGRSAGGSSGGAAAAVAAGIVPVAHGGDGAGSLRIPAACCGLFALKASRGLVPTGPLRGEGWGGLTTDGVVSRSVRDTAATLDAVCAPDPGAPYAGPVFARGLLAGVEQGLARRLRIAVWRTPFAGLPLAPECAEALDHTARLCASIGHEIVEVATPPFDYEAFVDAQADVLAANVVLAVERRLQTLGRALRDDDLEPAIRDGYEAGRQLSAAAYAAAIQRFHATGRWLHGCVEGHDLLLTPTLLQLPAPLGALATTGSFKDFRHRMARYSCFLALVNAAGQPAVNLPTHWTPAGLPVGTQLIGRHGSDDLLLQVSAQIEATGHWHPLRGRTA